jgi:hypothetical protein
MVTATAPKTVQTYSYSQLKQLWTANGGAPEWAPVMAGVALVESGGNPTETNPSGATGLWQIEVPLHGKTQAQMLDPNQNAAEAVYLLGDGSGISNWGTGTGDWLGTAVQAGGSKPWSESEVMSALAGKGTGTGGGTAQASLASIQFTSTGNYIGPGSWLINLDQLLNPAPTSGGWQDLLTLGVSSDIASIQSETQMLFIRGAFTLVAFGIIALGAKVAFGASPIHRASTIALGTTAEGRGIKRVFGNANVDARAAANAENRQRLISQNAAERDARARSREELRSHLRLNEQTHRANLIRNNQESREAQRRKTSELIHGRVNKRGPRSSSGGSSRDYAAEYQRRKARGAV